MISDGSNENTLVTNQRDEELKGQRSDMEKPREQYVLKAVTNSWTEEERGRHR